MMIQKDSVRERLHARDQGISYTDMPRRLLPLYRTPSGRLALDEAGTQLLNLDRKPALAQISTILQHTLPVPTAWVAGRARDRNVPLPWRSHALLADLILLPQDADDPTRPVPFGRHRLHLDDVLGLVHTEG